MTEDENTANEVETAEHAMDNPLAAEGSGERECNLTNPARR